VSGAHTNTKATGWSCGIRFTIGTIVVDGLGSVREPRLPLAGMPASVYREARMPSATTTKSAVPAAVTWLGFYAFPPRS
jgi:hypothetical protein